MNTYQMADWLAAFSDDILAVFDTERGCMGLSANWERITGVAKSGARRRQFYQHLGDGQEATFIRALTAAAAGNPEAPLLFHIRRDNGDMHAFQLRIGEVKRRIGGAYRIVCCFKDMRAAQAGEAERVRAEREARLASRTRAEFVSAINHDLRTPLNAILGFTQIMESGMYGHIDNPQYREYLRHMRESGYELLTRIDALAVSAHPAPALKIDAKAPTPPRREAHTGGKTIPYKALAAHA